MTRIDRLLALIVYLQSRRISRAEDIAEHFDVSLRSVYRDVASLGEIGIPVVAEAGVGYSLLKGFFLAPITFTPDEAAALATAGLLIHQFAGSALTAHMASALRKIRAVLPRDRQRQLEVLEQSMLGTRPPADPQSSANLHTILLALSERRALRFQYRGAGRFDTTPREVEPMGLLHYSDRWHVLAWDRAKLEYRDFRTDRMHDLALLKQSFAPRKDFVLADHARRITDPKDKVTARVRFTPLAAERARREAFLGVAGEKLTADGIVMTLSAAAIDWLSNWLLSFGTAVTVLEPAYLRAHLADTARAVATHHTK